MARFEITAPDGARYEVEGENHEGALAALQQHLGGAPATTGASLVPNPTYDAMGSVTGQEAPSVGPEGDWAQFKRGLQAIAENPKLLLNVGPARMARELPGAVADAAKLPGDVYTGKTDPLSPEGVDRTIGLGMMATPVNPAVRAGDFAIPAARRVETPQPGTALALPGEASAAPTGAPRVSYEPILNVRPEPAAVPSARELKEAGDTGYSQARAKGVDYSSESVAKLAREIKADLEGQGIIPETAPNTHAVLDRLTNPPPGSVANISGVDAARQAFGELVMGGSRTERKAAKAARSRFEEFLAAPDPSAVVAGPAAEAGKLVTEARGNIAASKRSDRLTELEQNAERRAEATNSGLNIDNTIRSRIASLLESPKARAGFSAEEVAALEEVARGTATRGTLRFLGNALGGGGGLGALAAGATGGAAGGALGGPLGMLAGVVPPAVGLAARKFANALTSRALRDADELVRTRSPLYEQRLRERAMKVADPERRASLLRAMGLSEEAR